MEEKAAQIVIQNYAMENANLKIQIAFMQLQIKKLEEKEKKVTEVK